MREILNILPPFLNKSSILVKNQGVGDIITGILHTHKIYAPQYDKISKSFWKGDARRTANAIYNFLKQNTHYKVEPDERQTLRSPSAILYMGADKNTGLDCKSYSLFSAGILDSLNRSGKKINWCYRFASYKIWDKLPHHVFVVINPGTGNEIWLDNVMTQFNEKKQYYYHIDKNINMALIAMAGVGRSKVKKEDRKKRIKAAIKKRGKVLLKFNPATASARNSFLLLVKVNAFKLATKLQKVPGAKLEKFWKGIGGNYQSLLKNIATGTRHKASKSDSVNGIGIVPAIAAAIAAATPIVLKVTQLLKTVGIKSDDLQNIGKKIVSKIIEKNIDNQASAEEDQENTFASASPEETNEAPEEFEQPNTDAGEESAMSGYKPQMGTRRRRLGMYA